VSAVRTSRTAQPYGLAHQLNFRELVEFRASAATSAEDLRDLHFQRGDFLFERGDLLFQRKVTQSAVRRETSVAILPGGGNMGWC
jgi:hypothetical protein